MLNKTFGIFIKGLRHKYQLSENDLSRRSKIPQQMISRIETTSHLPRSKTIIRLATAFRMPPSTLWNMYLGTGNHVNLQVKIEDAILDRHLSNTTASLKCHIGFKQFKKLRTEQAYPSPTELVKLGYGLNLNIKKLFIRSRYDSQYVNSFGYWLLTQENRPTWSQRKLAHKLHYSRQALTNYVHNICLPRKTDRFIDKVQQIITK